MVEEKEKLFLKTSLGRRLGWRQGPDPFVQVLSFVKACREGRSKPEGMSQCLSAAQTGPTGCLFGFPESWTYCLASAKARSIFPEDCCLLPPVKLLWPEETITQDLSLSSKTGPHGLPRKKSLSCVASECAPSLGWKCAFLALCRTKTRSKASPGPSPRLRPHGQACRWTGSPWHPCKQSFHWLHLRRPHSLPLVAAFPQEDITTY